MLGNGRGDGGEERGLSLTVRDRSRVRVAQVRPRPRSRVHAVDGRRGAALRHRRRLRPCLCGGGGVIMMRLTLLGRHRVAFVDSGESPVISFLSMGKKRGFV